MFQTVPSALHFREPLGMDHKILLQCSLHATISKINNHQLNKELFSVMFKYYSNMERDVLFPLHSNVQISGHALVLIGTQTAHWVTQSILYLQTWLSSFK